MRFSGVGGRLSRASRLLSTTHPTRIPKDGKQLKDFISNDSPRPAGLHEMEPSPSYDFNFPKNGQTSTKTRFHIETMGCQMNVSDSEIVHSVRANNPGPSIHPAMSKQIKGAREPLVSNERANIFRSDTREGRDGAHGRPSAGGRDSRQHVQYSG
eukprot:376868-Amorphochlora_amoeboformis.AAC.2